jgi:predicted NBD/HSP70 family sugar kinase
LNPEAIILGGGFVDALSDVLLPQIVKTLNRKALITPVHNLEIRIANLGDDAVMLGAALLAEEAKSKLTNA